MNFFDRLKLFTEGFIESWNETTHGPHVNNDIENNEAEVFNGKAMFDQLPDPGDSGHPMHEVYWK